METSQTPKSGIQQKLRQEFNQNPVECDLQPEKETDEVSGSEINQDPVETCQVTVMETGMIPEKQALPEAGLEVKQKPMGTCQEAAAEPDVNQEKGTSDPGVIYRCKKCQRMLATQEFIVTYEAGAGGKTIKAGKRFTVDEDDKKPECPCIFVEPMKWMQTVEEGYVAIRFFAWDAKLVWDNSTGLVCNAAAEPGWSQHFS